MQKNLSGVKHLRLTSSDEDLMSDFFQRDEDTDEKIIVIKKEGFGNETHNEFFVLKTLKMFEIFRKQNVSLSSLYLSGYLPEFELIEFIEKQSLEKLHVRGRFLDTCIFTIRKDFDEILKIMKMVSSDFHD